MGRAGIRRRKPRRRLPPARAERENDLLPPHVMWPERGGGFEAHPFSPAGETQRDHIALTRWARRTRPVTIARIVVVGCLVVVAAAFLASLL